MKEHRFLILVTAQFIFAHILVYLIIGSPIELILQGLAICLSIWWFIYLVYLIIKVTKKM